MKLLLSTFLLTACLFGQRVRLATNDVSGILRRANGGTGIATISSDNTILVSNGTTFIVVSLPNCTDTGGQHLNYNTSTHVMSCGTSGGGGGGGSVSSVGWTGGLISIATPTTTPAFTVAGTSGGVVYFNSASSWLSSGLLANHGVMLGGGTGGSPTAISSLGTTGQVFTSNGAGVDPSWQPAAGGGGAGITYCADATGSSTDYTCPSATGYTLTNGARATFVPQTTNTTATPTVAIQGGAPKNTLHSDGTALVAGELIGGNPYDIEYNGTTQRIMGEHLSAGASGAIVISRAVDPPTVDVTAAVPLKASANVWTGSNDFSGASKFATRIGTTDPATCDATTRELFFNSTSNLLKSCNTANTWTAISGGGGSTAPDPTDPLFISINEEWLTGNNDRTPNAGLGQNAFIDVAGNTLPTLTYDTPVANHFGILKVVTSATASEYTVIQGPTNGSVIGLNTATTWTLTSILKTDSGTTNQTNMCTGFGGVTTNSVAICYTPASSANWRIETCSASTCTYTDTGVAYANSTWYTFTIDSTVSGTIGGKVNAGSRVTTTSNIPSGALILLPLYISTNSTSHTILLDKYAIKFPVTR